MATIPNSVSKPLFFERIGKGFVISSRDDNGEFVTKYRVPLGAVTEHKTDVMTKFVERMIGDMGLPNELMLIETYKVPLTSRMAFSVTSKEIYNEDTSKRVLEGILNIGRALEKEYFSVKLLVRTA
jgi:hypothetical protein